MLKRIEQILENKYNEREWMTQQWHIYKDNYDFYVLIDSNHLTMIQALTVYNIDIEKFELMRKALVQKS